MRASTAHRQHSTVEVIFTDRTDECRTLLNIEFWDTETTAVVRPLQEFSTRQQHRESRHAMLHHIMHYHLISSHFFSLNIVSCIIQYFVIQYHTLQHLIIQYFVRYHTMQHHIIQHQITSHYIRSAPATPTSSYSSCWQSTAQYMQSAAVRDIPVVLSRDNV
jgi:hypothetical protein